MVSQRRQHLGSVPCMPWQTQCRPHRRQCLGLRNIVNIVGEDTYTPTLPALLLFTPYFAPDLPLLFTPALPHLYPYFTPTHAQGARVGVGVGWGGDGAGGGNGAHHDSSHSQRLLYVSSPTMFTMLRKPRHRLRCGRRCACQGMIAKD